MSTLELNQNGWLNHLEPKGCSDASSQTYTASINWSDGIVFSGTVISEGSGEYSVTGSDTYTF